MKYLYPVLLLFIVGCQTKEPKFNIPSPIDNADVGKTIRLADSVYYDKVLGALVGSAIGDAMGASTEMWHRNDIQLNYGYINGLTPAVREQSPEGTWEHNLLAGATTDDTRWKSLMVHYFKTNNKMDAASFSQFIIDYYGSLTKALSNKDINTSTDALDEQIEKIDWIKEWARVSMAFQESSHAYSKAQHRFYGGEMSCAGQLYSPMVGLVTKSPLEAYEKAYELSLFDIGYAKDITALVAAMTHKALKSDHMDSIMNAPKFIDPIGYADSRLVGRIPTVILDGAQKNIRSINQLQLNDSLALYHIGPFETPKGFKGDKKDWIRQEMLYQLLEKDQRGIAFHSAEIWQILVTGLAFGEGDFNKTIQFIVNYGRDNDTVAAVAGMILGAKIGYKGLPEELRETIIKVNKNNLGIDLKALAKEMVQP